MNSVRRNGFLNFTDLLPWSHRKTDGFWIFQTCNVRIKFVTIHIKPMVLHSFFSVSEKGTRWAGGLNIGTWGNWSWHVTRTDIEDRSSIKFANHMNHSWWIASADGMFRPPNIHISKYRAVITGRDRNILIDSSRRSDFGHADPIFVTACPQLAWRRTALISAARLTPVTRWRCIGHIWDRWHFFTDYPITEKGDFHHTPIVFTQFVFLFAIPETLNLSLTYFLSYILSTSLVLQSL
jgi:hypothetical protein